MEKDIKNTSIPKLAWPIFVQAFFSMCLGYADSIMLSRYSQTAVGAIGNSNQILGFLTLAFSIISSATSVIVSQYLGAKLKDKISQVYTVAIAFNLVLSLAISIIIFLGGNALLTFMNVPNEMMIDAEGYMSIVGGFIFTQALIDTFSKIFISNGKTVIGMVISFAMNIVNVIGNYLFLYGPLETLGFGAQGVAISTTVSRIIALIASIIYFAIKIEGNISLKYLKPFPKEIFNSMLKIGLPTAGENISYNIAQIFVSTFVNTLGTIAINARIYANILCNFSYLYSMSVAIATSIVVGHAVGGNDYEFAYKRVLKTMKSAIVIGVGIAIINCLIEPFSFTLFDAQEEVIALGKSVMIVAIFLEFGRTTNLVVINSMKSAGDVKFPVILGMLSQWGIAVGVSYLLGIVFDLGLVGIWIGLALDEIVRGVVVFIRWKRKTWMGKSVVVNSDVAI